MARCILIYGQPASGKSFSMRNLDPASTVIIDADKKGALPWRGWRKKYSKENKNFFKINSLDTITDTMKKIGRKSENAYIKAFVVDGLNNAMIDEKVYYNERNNTRNGFEKYEAIRDKVYKLIDTAQDLRDDLTVIITAHVATADPYVENDVDKIFTPGKALEKEIKVESKFVYVFYAKSKAMENGEMEFYFETAPIRSTARSPEGCFNVKISNDIDAAIKIIEIYEMTEKGGNADV